MWVKTDTDSYYNLLTGTQIEVRQARSESDWRIQVLNGMNVSVVCLQKGFSSEEDAKEALATLFEELEDSVLSIDAPENEDEVEESEDTELPSYDEMTIDQLKAELSGRPGNLSTSGNKADLINRLIEDDEKQEAN